MSPRVTLGLWIDAFNAADADRLADLDGRIRFQRGYWDKLSFLKMHGLPIPTEL